MDSFSNDTDELFDDNIADNFDDREDAIGASDDSGVDTEENQIFDEILHQEVQQGNEIACEPEESFKIDNEEVNDNEEIDENDSGVEDNDTLGKDQTLEETRSFNLQPNIIVGRGRLGKTAVDENNQELQPPGHARDILPEEGFYPKPSRIARFPPSYYQKREDPAKQAALRAARRALPALIDFQAKFNQISFIIDKDDSGMTGYHHACNRLQQNLTDIKLDLSKTQHDIWSFGLYIYSIEFSNDISCNLLNMFPEKINNEENRPFWFTFKSPPTFKDSILSKKISKETDLGKGLLIDREIYADISYGALISMYRFAANKDYVIRKKSRWSLRFRDEFFEIQTNQFRKSHQDPYPTVTQIKYKIPIDIIDRAAVIHLRNDGFILFLNMKGNIHEFSRQGKLIKDKDNDFGLFKRQGIRNDKEMPLFSTIRIRMLLRDEQSIIDSLERESKIQQNMSSNEKDLLIRKNRDDSLNQIREVLKNLLHFFYKNRIHVCFGSMTSKDVPLAWIATINYETFPTFMQLYSWAMLCNIGFRVQVQLYKTKQFIKELHNYSKKQDCDKNDSDIDNRFYSLCLYLHRRSSEYFFLDFDQEIQIGIEECKNKYQQFQRNNSKSIPSDEKESSTAYIPSIVLTPTMIKIRPLKLCKLNRILREENLFGGVLNFALVELRDEAQRLLFATEFRSLKDQIWKYLTDGFSITTRRIYKYLHHSQSQVKSKQFWFYYHDKENGYLSHEDAYSWMGNFDKERVVAKHTARIALCFTSTDKTIQITADKVTYVRDIKDKTKKYTFTDGVGTISTKLRDEIKNYLGRRYEFSVLQIRYGGCKGTLSVDPGLDNQQYQLRIRDSMNKFISDHDILELCKLSAPRKLYLNRQDIVLLESRDIPHVNFLHLQNKYHLWLIRSLLSSSIAYELLQEKLLPVFKLRKIARNINIIEEPFFIKLIITCAFNIIRELLDKTKIDISEKKGRNMFGIVDEYGVLEYGQVFIQHTVMRENKLKLPKKEEEDDDDNDDFDRCEIITGKVVITKNPCHHPGDLRTFQAVDYPQLRHLKDVVVFPQKGHRPHSNEISGSDLDGDEYVVIWHEDLIPNTPNEDPYEYDSQEDPPKMDRPITRDDINKVVMEVSEQDCLGTLSNIHLAYVDKCGIKSEICKDLAGAISQEVDAAKTGKHPLNEEEITDLRKGLENKWPDFMKSRGKKEFYPSERVLGKLYRSARRALIGWSRAINNHGNSHHKNLVTELVTNTNIKNEDNDKFNTEINPSTTIQQPLDPDIYHKDYKNYSSKIKSLYKFYQNELLEIISLYHFQDEIDLFCRCDSMDSSGGGNKKGSLEDSAVLEVKNLIQKIYQEFFAEFNQRRLEKNCCKLLITSDDKRMKRIDCEICRENKLAKAACAYIYSYEQSNNLSSKSNRRILSFPWLFSTFLIKLRNRNQSKNFSKQMNYSIERSNTIVGEACSIYLENVIPKFKIFIPKNFIDSSRVEFYYEKIEEKQTNSLLINKKSDEKSCSTSLLHACFIEIINDWLIKQNIFGNSCNETDLKPLIPISIWHELIINFLSNESQTNIRILLTRKSENDMIERNKQIMNNYRLKWSNTEYRELFFMFHKIHSLIVKYAKITELTIWTYLDEYIILALQCIGIEKRLVDNWICPSDSY